MFLFSYPFLHKLIISWYKLIQCSKTNYYTCIQKNLYDVNAKNASSGLREKVILTNLVPKYGGKNLVAKCRMGRERRLLGRTLLTQRSYCVPPSWGWSRGTWRGVCRGITVNGEPAYPVAPHPRCIATGTCQGSCLEGVIDWCTRPPWWSWWCPGTLYHYKEVIQLNGMTCSLGMFKDGGSPEAFLVPVSGGHIYTYRWHLLC